MALRLAAACLQTGADPDDLADELADDDGSPVQYLTGRMLDGQPPALRRLLLRKVFRKMGRIFFPVRDCAA